MVHIDKRAFTFVIFGATGDLATKKLIPAIFALFRKEKLPLQFAILAVSRRDWKDADFKSFIREMIPHHEKGAEGDFDEFLDRVYYSKVFFDQNKGYIELHDKLREIDKVFGVKSTKLFYLSLAPKFYENVFTWVGEAKLFEDISSRLLVEKPFGVDEASADKLHAILKKYLHESQILFVDHYLGKDSLRAIRPVHSSPKNFHFVLPKKNIESIRMRIFETHGVEKRATSYDGVGAFRDIAQNHMIVMLSTIVAPCTGVWRFWCHYVRARTIRSLALLGIEGAWARHGQYVGYTQEEDVAKDSQTETAFTFNTVFTRGRLKGVKVIFEGGKKLPQAFASVEIFLKNNEMLTVNIQPEQSIVTKTSQGHDTIVIEKRGGAYEHVFIGAMKDDVIMFASFKEIKAAWRLADSVINSWKDILPIPYSLEKPFIVP